jgi:hypothetical protein
MRLPYTALHLTLNYPTILHHLEMLSQEAKRASSHKHVCNTQTSISEPEDGMSSDIESFDEGDMYPATYNDESACDGPEMELHGESQQSPLDEVTLETLVCASFHIHLQISNI